MRQLRWKDATSKVGRNVCKGTVPVATPADVGSTSYKEVRLRGERWLVALPDTALVEVTQSSPRVTSPACTHVAQPTRSLTPPIDRSHLVSSNQILIFHFFFKSRERHTLIIKREEFTVQVLASHRSAAITRFFLLPDNRLSTQCVGITSWLSQGPAFTFH